MYLPNPGTFPGADQPAPCEAKLSIGGIWTVYGQQGLFVITYCHRTPHQVMHLSETAHGALPHTLLQSCLKDNCEYHNAQCLSSIPPWEK